MATRVHRVAANLADGRRRYYYYAWRKGPLFWTSDGETVDYANPPAGFAKALEQARADHTEDAIEARGRTVRALIERFERAGEFKKLAARTRETYTLYLKQIDAEFGEDAVSIFDTDDIVSDILEWRDKKAEAGQYRAADHRVRTLARLLTFAKQIKWCRENPAEGLTRLYDGDRSDVVFEPAERAVILHGDGKDIAPCPAHIAEIFMLAFYSGARRADLVSMSINADHGSELRWRTSKSRAKVEALVPILPPLRALLDRRKAQRGVSATTILVNSRGKPWTARGLSDMVAKRLAECGIEGKHLHDCRGTLATELCVAGYDDRLVAEIMGWEPERVARIRRRYVNRDRLIRERIARLDRNG